MPIADPVSQLSVLATLDDSSQVLSAYTTSRQARPAITLDSSGDFTIVWESGGNQDGDGEGIFGQVLGPDGSPKGSEFQVNTTTLGDQVSPAVAPFTAGGSSFVTVWESEHQGAGDPRVLFQRFFIQAVFTEDFETGNAGRWSAVTNPE